MAWLGGFFGAIIGAYVYGFRGLVAGAAIGIVIGLVLRRRPAALTAPRAAAASPAGEAGSAARIAALEQRLATLEIALARAGFTLPAAAQAVAPPAAAPAAAAARVVAPAADAARDAMTASQSPVRKGGAGEASVASASATAVPSATVNPSATAARSPSRPAPAATPQLWSWFTNGNTMVRVGVVVLFFGVAFLLSYFAEHVNLPIELQFAGVALAGGVLIGLGAWLRNARPAYALALIGGGLGVLYLTTFAAFQLVPLLSPDHAFLLLAAIAALAIVLSLLFDAQPLAVLAALGGLLAPVLVKTVSEPLQLFGYVTAVNAIVVGIAWFRAWRALDLVGFLGTFALGLWWGHEYYDPAYFRVVEPFLAAFFLAYVAVPIVHSLRGAAGRKVDSLLTFGVPMVALGLQALLVADTRYGLAWTAAVMAALYALLWRALRGRKNASIATLATAFGALAVIFATLTLPLAVDARWTSAAWAVEAAGVYWLGCRLDHHFARGFALLLQLASGIAFLVAGSDEYAELAFANRQFLGCAAIALAGFASVRFGDRRDALLPVAERSLLQLLFGWACVWWLGGGLAEIARTVSIRTEAHAMLAWIVGSIALAVLLARPLRWPRLDGTAVVLLPALTLALGHDVAHGRTSVTDYGWVVYPLAWALHFALLHRREARAAARATAAATDPAGLRPWLAAAHAFGALLLLGQLAWEAGEWTARVTPPATVWAACAHLLPLAVYLLVVTRVGRVASWPMRTFAEAYAVTAGTVVAVLLGLGFVALALLSPGDARPLRYVPLANPMELTLSIVLAALFLWAREHARLALQTVYRWLGVGVFVVLNGIVARTVHHWLGVPWQFQALVASRPLQAALTLTWTVAALAAMVAATKRRLRALWLTGAGLLAAVVIKLFAIDLAALSGLSRVVAFLGVGALLLVIGYLAPLPPQPAEGVPR
ncbi:MAG TPA: DUF2339 domain-containing protein [Casimicrobiaceae bacterium]|jgi:uncharacterized membrane protein|nr:DUF2339 domain-containing protein [Casimicrobiaceae bacterium]